MGSTAERETDPSATSTEAALRELTFGGRLAALRVKAGLSQSELAGEDLSASYVSLLEADKRRPSGDVVALLAGRIGCSPSMLLDGQPSERERRVELELAYSRLALTHGEAQSALDRLRSLVAEGSLDRRTMDETLLLIANAHEHLGDLEQAATVLGPLFERAQRGESHLPVSVIGVTLTGCFVESGDFRHAVDVGERAFRSAVEQGLVGTDDYFRLGSTLMWAYLESGDDMHAATWGASLIEEVDRHGNSAGQAAIYWNASLVSAARGKVDEALHLSQRALARLGESDDSRNLARLRISIAELLLRVDPPRAQEAWRTLEMAREPLLDLGSRVERVVWSTTAAHALLHLGKVTEASDEIEEALRGLDKLEAREAAATLITAGDVSLALAQPGAALGRYEEAAARLNAGPANRIVSRLWRELGDRFREVGADDAALRSFDLALTGVGLRGRTGELRAQLRRLAAGSHRQSSNV